jgi:hypothetical protein
LNCYFLKRNQADFYFHQISPYKNLLCLFFPLLQNSSNGKGTTNAGIDPARNPPTHSNGGLAQWEQDAQLGIGIFLYLHLRKPESAG